MALRPKKWKKFNPSTTDTFFVIKKSATEHFLYESGFGVCLEAKTKGYGSVKMITGCIDEIKSKQKSTNIFWMDVGGDKTISQNTGKSELTNKKTLNESPSNDNNFKELLIDPSKLIFYIIEVGTANWYLYDSDFGTPISYKGKKSFTKTATRLIVSQLPKESTIFHYKVNGNNGLKLKMKITPSGGTPNDEVTKQQAKNIDDE